MMTLQRRAVNFLQCVSDARNLGKSLMAQRLTTSVLHHLGALTELNEAQNFDLGTPECVCVCLGLAGDAAAKAICKFQDWKNYSLLTRAHLALLPYHLFLSSLTFLSKVFKIHSFLSLSTYRITSNPVLRGLQERKVCL